MKIPSREAPLVVVGGELRYALWELLRGISRKRILELKQKEWKHRGGYKGRP